MVVYLAPCLYSSLARFNVWKVKRAPVPALVKPTGTEYQSSYFPFVLVMLFLTGFSIAMARLAAVRDWSLSENE